MRTRPHDLLTRALAAHPLPTTDGHTVAAEELVIQSASDWLATYYHRDAYRAVHIVTAPRRLCLARERGSETVDLWPGDVLVPIGAVYNLDPVNRWPL